MDSKYYDVAQILFKNPNYSSLEGGVGQTSELHQPIGGIGILCKASRLRISVLPSARAVMLDLRHIFSIMQKLSFRKRKSLTKLLFLQTWALYSDFSRTLEERALLEVPRCIRSAEPWCYRTRDWRRHRSSGRSGSLSRVPPDSPHSFVARRIFPYW